MYTDEQRLQQILKNLLSNAFKFTEQGSVKLHIRKADANPYPNHSSDKHAGWGIVISVEDTGIGIPTRQTGNYF